MLNFIGKFPRTHFHVACSGGSDSMVIVDFLRKYPKNHFDIIHFNHGTECCDEAEEFVTKFCNKNNIELHVGKISKERKPNESREEYWRRCRYDFFMKFSNEPILLSHHLNDCIETWIMTSLRGKPHLIPYYNAKYNIFRPFLTVPKSEIEKWAKEHDVKYVIDKSNFDTTINRNYVRHVMMKNVYQINPGIEKTIKRKIVEAYNDSISIST